MRFCRRGDGESEETTMSEPRVRPPLRFGRSTRWTPELWDEILLSLANGTTAAAAYGRVGVPTSTFYHWLKHGIGYVDADGEEHRYEPEELKSSIDAAEASAETRFSLRFRQAADAGDWKAAESWLKRRRKADWGDNVTATVESKSDGATETLTSKMEALAARLAAQEAATEDA